MAGFKIAAVKPQILTPTGCAGVPTFQLERRGVAAFVRPAAQKDFADLPLLSEHAERGAAYVVIGDLGIAEITERLIGMSGQAVDASCP
jgi:hypothetical protein